MTSKRFALVLAALLAPICVAAAPSDPFLTYSGYLYKPDGTAETAAQSVKFSLWNLSAGGNAANLVWEETHTVTPGPGGYFSQVLGATVALPLAAEWDTQLYLELQVGAEPPMAPRVAITPVARALSVGWAAVTGKPSACASGSYLRGYDAAGAPLCDTAAAGTVTSVGATANGGAAIGGTAAAPTVGLMTCSNGQILKAGATPGTWACATDALGTVTSVTATASAGIAMGGTGIAPTVGLQSCPNGQVLKAGATAGTWACGTDSDTTYGSGAGISVASGYVGLSTVGCGTGYVWKYSGAAWQCQPDAGVTNVSTTGTGNPITVTNGATTPTLAFRTCSNAQVLEYDTTTGWNCKFEPEVVTTAGCGLNCGSLAVGDTTTTITVNSISIQAPAAGTVEVDFNGAVECSVAAATEDIELYGQILSSATRAYGYLDGGAMFRNTTGTLGTYDANMNAHRTFTVAGAGTYTYYYRANSWAAGATAAYCKFYAGNMTAVYRR